MFYFSINVTILLEQAFSIIEYAASLGGEMLASGGLRRRGVHPVEEGVW
jgi:hypothetical protein